MVNRVSANLSMLFTHVPLIQRYELASKAGFKLVEVSLPYSESAESLRKAADEHGLEHTLINSPTGDWNQGFRGIAALASKLAEFRASIDTAIEYAKVLNCDKVHVMAGVPRDVDDSSKADQIYAHNLKFAAEKLASANLVCLIEPINHYTVPGYFLKDYEQAAKLIKSINLGNLKIQYDLFHAQQINGQLIATMKNLKDFIGYIQVAQVPHRGNCGTRGEIDYNFLFEQIKQINDSWIIGCEYVDPDVALEWFSPPFLQPNCANMVATRSGKRTHISDESVTKLKEEQSTPVSRPKRTPKRSAKKQKTPEIEKTKEETPKKVFNVDGSPEIETTPSKKARKMKTPEKQEATPSKTEKTESVLETPKKASATPSKKSKKEGLTKTETQTPSKQQEKEKSPKIETPTPSKQQKPPKIEEVVIESSPEVVELEEAESQENLEEESQTSQEKLETEGDDDDEEDSEDDDDDDDAPEVVTSKKNVECAEQKNEHIELPEVTGGFEQLMAKKAEKESKEHKKRAEKRKKKKSKKVVSKGSKESNKGIFKIKVKKSRTSFKVVTLEKGVKNVLEPEHNYREELLKSRTCGVRLTNTKQYIHRAKWVNSKAK
ncbi:unnamed protein product [Caenorhabditis bovis]|uniref:Putative hydroxypyruvate isomerase n=1 Tax=Caenorhabditis bovis TaxID=2654633 RepID=A0A8S1FE83_9PELO|nr:unnamed protein product [Caenorhabditis bovis]